MRTPRTTLLALMFALLALAAAGCGGSEVAADEVPGAPPALTVPTDGALGSGSGANTGASTDESAADESDADSGAATDGAATAEPTAQPTDPSGGTTAPETPAPDEGAAADPAQPPADSPPEQFESFCEQNAGAC